MRSWGGVEGLVGACTPGFIEVFVEALLRSLDICTYVFSTFFLLVQDSMESTIPTLDFS